MIIDISQLSDNEPEEIISSEEFDGFKIYHDLKVLTPIKLYLRASFKHGLLNLELDISYNSKAICSRCLKEFIQEQNIKFKEEYTIKQIEEAFSENVINTEQTVKELIVLKVPIKNLCKDTCLGICAVCGKDKNEFDCNCENEISNSYFDNLKILLCDKDKEV